MLFRSPKPQTPNPKPQTPNPSFSRKLRRTLRSDRISIFKTDRADVYLIMKLAIHSLTIVFLAAVLMHSTLSKSNRKSSSDSNIETDKSKSPGKDASILTAKRPSRRMLASLYKTIDVKNYRTDQTLVFKNVFGFDESTDLSKSITFLTDPSDSASSPTEITEDIVRTDLGNNEDYIVVQMDEATQIDNQYLYLKVAGLTNEVTTLRSEDKIYQYYDSSASSTLAVSLVFAVVFMIFACCCWISGVRQFYLLIRIPQMIFMLNLMGSKPHASNFFSFVDNFKYNLLTLFQTQL